MVMVLGLIPFDLWVCILDIRNTVNRYYSVLSRKVKVIKCGYVLELVNKVDSKSTVERLGGSTPSTRTNN